MITGTSFNGVSATLHDLFSRLMRPLETAALVQPEGAVLFVQTQNAADVGTLPAAASLCHKYLHLASGDIALTNDPYSGGTHLSDFTLVMGIGLNPMAKTLDLLLTARIKLAPPLPPGKKLDDEGVRVPPMPLGQATISPSGTTPAKADVNQDLLKAIASHPLAPPGLVSEISATLEKMLDVASSLRRIARDPGSPLRKPNFETYLEDSSRVFDSLMGRIPLGTSQIARHLPTGEMMKVQLRVNEDRIVFDFGGSDPSRESAAGPLALTDLQTFGACWAALVAPFDEILPMNSGTLQHLQVSSPSRTLVSAAAPSPTFRGAHEGVAHIGRLAFDVLAKSQPAFKIASGPETNGLYQVLFQNGRRLALEIPPGNGASGTAQGSDAVSSWSRTHGFVSAAEDLETRFPVRWLSAGFRKGSGGGGKFRGGQGSSLAFSVLEACELRWMDSSIGRKADGTDGGRAGLASTIEIVRTGRSDREILSETSGTVQLAPGDQVHLLSGGGGGFGESNAPESAES